jgi:hypothetical protein
MRRIPLTFALILLILLAIVGCTLATNEPTRIAPTRIPPTPASGFQVQQVSTPFSTLPPPTPFVVTMTPVAQPVATDIPGPQPGEQTENIVEALINRILIPVWNFLYTFITGSIVSLWDFAGLRGGLMAQMIFCLIPGMFVTFGVLWRLFRRGR